MQQEPDYLLRVIADLEFAEMAYAQGNSRMAEVAYNEALKDLMPLKGRVDFKEFETLRRVAVSGLEQACYSMLMESAGVKSFFQAEKLLEDAENPIVAEYRRKIKGVYEESRILKDSLPLHGTVC